jgi:predicted AAA+ superfamily ATPase
MVKMQGMNKLISRLQISVVKKYLKKFPVVAVVGARQTGKTTLVRDLLKEKRLFLSLDDSTNILLAQQDPLSFLEQAGEVTIDEIQKAPFLLNAIKQIVDKKRKPGQFLITGSANITMLPSISETLAGRIVFVEMFPFTVGEVLPQRKDSPGFMEVLKIKSVKKCWEFLQQIKPRSFSLEESRSPTS